MKIEEIEEVIKQKFPLCKYDISIQNTNMKFTQWFAIWLTLVCIFIISVYFEYTKLIPEYVCFIIRNIITILMLNDMIYGDWSFITKNYKRITGKEIVELNQKYLIKITKVKSK